MRKAGLFILIGIIFASCSTTKQVGSSNLSAIASGIESPNPPITKSLFDDKSSTISEENIQKILDGN